MSSKILIHAINFAPELIGCGKYTTELAKFLEGNDHQIEVITAPPHYPGWFVREPYSSYRYADETIGKIKVSRCPMFMRRDGGGIWRLLAPLTFAVSAAPILVWKILRFRPDVVLCVEPTLFSAFIAGLIGQLIGARTVLHVQDLEVDAAFEMGHIKGGTIRKLALYFEKFIMRKFDRIVTISQKMRAALIAKGLPEEQVYLLRNWVDLESIMPTEDRGLAYRSELGLDMDTFVVLYSGSIGVKQGLDVLLDAARRLSNDNRFHFVIAGDGPAKATLQRSYADLTNVSYLPMQPVERLNELLSLADLHALPQRKGAADLVMPSKLGGMLASGRLIVATVDAGTELFDMLTGIALLSPSGDEEALANAILRAANEDFSHFTKNGLPIAELLNASRILPRFEQLLLATDLELRN